MSDFDRLISFRDIESTIVTTNLAKITLSFSQIPGTSKAVITLQAGSQSWKISDKVYHRIIALVAEIKSTKQVS